MTKSDLLPAGAPRLLPARAPRPEENEMSETGKPVPQKKPAVYKSKKQIKEAWAKLHLEDPDRKTPAPEQEALNKIYEDDLFGLGNE